MHLITRRRANDVLPAELPSYLLPPHAWGAANLVADSLALGISPPPPSAPPPNGTPSVVTPQGRMPPSLPSSLPSARGPWSMSGPERAKYEEVFRTVLQTNAQGQVEGSDARRFLERSNLPDDDLALICTRALSFSLSLSLSLTPSA